MGTSVFEYDADQIAIIFGNIVIDSGYAEDSLCKVEKDADDFIYTVGIDGSVTRSKTKNKVLKVTFMLMQSSPLNDQLSALNILDVASPNGAGIVAFGIKDLNGTSFVKAAHAWITKPADMEWSRGAKVREWPIICADGTMFVGSNPQL